MVSLLLDDLVAFEECVAGAEPVIALLSPLAGAAAAAPLLLEDEGAVLWAKLGRANAIAAARVDALRMKPNRDFIVKSS